MDRNPEVLTKYGYPVMSLSARRAWIEIALIAPIADTVKVALRKESVDRNITVSAASRRAASRSPQGERG